MKQKPIICPICGNKLKFKSSKDVNFGVQLSKAENEVFCKKCDRWIKFNIEERGK